MKTQTGVSTRGLRGTPRQRGAARMAPGYPRNPCGPGFIRSPWVGGYAGVPAYALPGAAISAYDLNTPRHSDVGGHFPRQNYSADGISASVNTLSP